MEDGNALVYGGQRNSGAAAFNQPALQIGHTPLDVEAARLYQENQINEQRKYAEAKQKEKEKAAALKGLEDIDLSTFALGNQQEFLKDIAAHKNMIAQDMLNGENPTDPTSPAYLRTQQRFAALGNKKIELDRQGKIIDDAIKTVNADYDNPNPVLDHEKTMAAIKAYAEAPNMEARRAIDPNSLLVRKPKKFDTLEALKDFKIAPYVGSFGTDSPTGGSSGSTLNKKNLRTDIEAIANNPINDENYQQGVKEGVWNSRKEYADWLYQNAENKYTPDFKSVKKIPKATTLIDIEKGNTAEQLKALGVGEQTANITINDSRGNPIEGQISQINIPNAVTLGNINIDVPAATIILADTGKKGESTKNFKLVSGTMGTPLVYKQNNRVVPLNSESISYQKDGKWITLSKKDYTSEQITQKLIDDGVAEYKPMIFGNAEYTSDDGTKTLKTAVWLPANAAIHGTDKKDKALTSAEAAYHILEKASKEKNDINGNQAQDEWNAAWDKLKAGETMVGLDGKTYVKT